jgi:surface polysaccharide O-acyltransferase-like enzyme
MNMGEINLWVCAALVAAGILFHFVLKLQELEQQGQIVTPWSYWAQHPYTSLSVVMAAYLFMALQYALGELSHSAAILTGIACNSLGDKMRARSQKI